MNRRPPKGGRRFSQRTKQRVAALIFVLPNMIALGLFSLWPLVNGFRESFYKEIAGQPVKFDGLTNYREILSDAAFAGAVRNTVEFVIGFVVLTAVLATGTAVLLHSQRFAKGFFRAAIYVPVLISPIIVGIMWSFILNPTYGALDAILHKLGIGQPQWLVQPHLAMICAIGVEIWVTLGFYTLILLGGLQSIDSNLYDAASIDRASAWSKFWYVTFPGLRPSLLIVLILSMINGFQIFTLLYTLTGGGPLGATTLIVQFIYDHAFVPPNLNFGLALAGSVLLFLVLMVLTLISFIVGRRGGAA